MNKILLPESTAIEALSYSKELNMLFVYFRPNSKQSKGGIYCYFNVPLTEWANLTAASSSGKYLNQVVKTANYPYHQVKAPVPLNKKK